MQPFIEISECAIDSKKEVYPEGAQSVIWIFQDGLMSELGSQGHYKTWESGVCIQIEMIVRTG